MARKQQMFLDGIRQSILMARIAYSRLEHVCIVHEQTKGSGPNSAEVSNDMLSQSWLIVDASNRLRVFVRSMPGLSHSAAWHAVTRAVAPAEPFRNYIQHLDMDTELGEPRPLWGTLRWITPMPKEDGGWNVAVHFYVPGPVAVGPVEPALSVKDLMKSEFRMPVDDITLTAAGRSLNLTTLVDGIDQFGRRLDAAAARTEWAEEDVRTRIDIGMDDDVQPEPRPSSVTEPSG